MEKTGLFEFAQKHWELTLVTVALATVVVGIAMLFKPTRKILFRLIEKFMGFQLRTFEEKAVAKSRRIVKEAQCNDNISRCKKVLAAAVTQAGSIVERGVVISFKVREYLSCPIAISIGDTKF